MSDDDGYDVHFETPWSPREATQQATCVPSPTDCDALYAFFKCTAHRSSADLRDAKHLPRSNASRCEKRPPSPAGADSGTRRSTDIVYIEVDIDGDILPDPCCCMNATDETGDCVWTFCGYQHYWLCDEAWSKVLYFETVAQYQDYLNNDGEYTHAFAASIVPHEDFHQVGQKQALVKSAGKQ